MTHVHNFLRFWYDFVIGDDWTVALCVALALGATALLTACHVAAWWLTPAAVVVVLAVSLRRATRSAPRSGGRTGGTGRPGGRG
jgi:hypothetical protein